MSYKQKSSGLPFKQMGSSPMKAFPGLAGPKLSKNASKKLDRVGNAIVTGGMSEAKNIMKPVGELANKAGKKVGLDLKGYLSGKQGFIPDYKGNSTKKTVNKIAKRVEKATSDKPKAKKVSQKLTTAPGADKKMLGKKKGRLMKDSTKKVARPSKKSTITDNKSMKPPYKKPVGPRAK